jgi:hypothetical protein
MKHLKKFEDNNTDNYVIITKDFLPIDFVINVEKDEDSINKYSFRYLHNLVNSKIIYYTLEDAKKILPDIIKHKPGYNFEIVKEEDIEILINMEKYNL